MTITTQPPQGATRFGRYRFRSAVPQANLGDGWLEGVSWVEDPCTRPTVRRYTNVHCDGCWEQPAEPKPATADCPPETLFSYPFEIVMPDDCHTWSIGWDNEARRQRRITAIENTLDYALATALFSGNQADPDDPTPKLLDAVALTDTALTPALALGMLADASADVRGQVSGIMFGSELAAGLLAGAQLATPGTGGSFQTVMGVPLVIGPGIPPGINTATTPGELIDGSTPTPAEPGESWLYLARSADWTIEAPMRDLLTQVDNEAGGDTIGASWSQIMANRVGQLTEVSALVRLSTCGLLAVKVRGCCCG